MSMYHLGQIVDASNRIYSLNDFSSYQIDEDRRLLALYSFLIMSETFFISHSLSLMLTNCCSLTEQRPEPAPWLEGEVNCPSWSSEHAGQTLLGREVLSSCFTAYSWVCLHGNKTRHSWSTAEPALVNSPVELFPNDLMWLLPIKVWAERSHFVFLLAKLYVSVFSLFARHHFRSFSPLCWTGQWTCSTIITSFNEGRKTVLITSLHF